MAMIGAGRMANSVHYPALASLQDVRFQCAISTRPAIAPTIATTDQIDPPDGRWYDSAPDGWDSVPLWYKMLGAPSVSYDVSTLGAYTFADAARYVRAPVATVRAWFLGTKTGWGTFQPVLHLDDSGHRMLSTHVLPYIARITRNSVRLVFPPPETDDRSGNLRPRQGL